MDGLSTGWKEGFKASERYLGRYPSIPRAIPQNGENSPLPVICWGSHHPFFSFFSSIDLPFTPFFVPTGRPCKIPLGRNYIEKSFLARFEPVSGQFPGAEGYGEVANSMVRKAEVAYLWQGRRPLGGYENKSWIKRIKHFGLQGLIFVRAILYRRIDSFKKWVPGLYKTVGKIEK